MKSLFARHNCSLFIIFKGDGMITLELKELFSKFTNDVIATAAFGIQVDSFKNPDNIFLRMGTKAINFAQGWGMLRFLVLTFLPSIAKVNSKH